MLQFRISIILTYFCEIVQVYYCTIPGSFQISYELKGDEQSIFTTTVILDLQTCIQLCKLYATCELINYHRRGNLCKLTHVYSEYNETKHHSLDKRAGVISWLKVDQVDSVSICKAGDERNYCNTFCGKYFKHLNGNVFDGNLVEAGSKLVCNKCFTPEDPPSRMDVTAKCQLDGNWTFTYTICKSGVCKIKMTDDLIYIMARISNELLNYNNAVDNCKLYNMTLVKITTYHKLQFYVELIQDFVDGACTGYKIREKCESQGGGYTQCTPTSLGFNSIVEATVADQLSNTLCKKNDNWGFSRRAIWADKGCRAVFELCLGESYWIDAHDVNMSWQTSDGQSISTQVINHYDGQQPCARILLPDYDVLNRECEFTFGFICEF